MKAKRNKALERIGWAFGTLKSAINAINIGEDIPGCDSAVCLARLQAKQQIAEIQFILNELEKIV